MTYHRYGEGYIHHNGHPCDIGLDEHPQIHREDWPSRRRYLWSQVCRRLIRYVGWRSWVLTGAFPVDVPTVRAAIRPDESIRPRRGPQA